MLEQQIHMLRKERGWSQTELAKRMQISEKAIKNWERGISKPSASNIVTLAKIFCVSTDYLFGLERRTPPLYRSSARIRTAQSAFPCSSVY